MKRNCQREAGACALVQAPIVADINLSMPESPRVPASSTLFPHRQGGGLIHGRGPWPARWILCPEADVPPFVTAYRLRFTLDAPCEFHAAVSAADRYELFLNGERIGRGPERGDLLCWHFETYSICLPAGDNTLVARVWSLGSFSPLAQMSAPAGFLFAPLHAPCLDRFATGRAAWTAKLLRGYEFTPAYSAWRTGARLAIDGARFPWHHEAGAGDDWRPAQTGRPAFDDPMGKSGAADPLLSPATLLPMMNRAIPPSQVRYVAATDGGDVSRVPLQAALHRAAEASAWEKMLQRRGVVTIAPHTHRRVLVDLGDYYCAYHDLRMSGGAGAVVSILWQESLFMDARAQTKGQRDDIEGKFFIDIDGKCDGVGDVFKPDGGRNRRFESLWWHAGRFVELLVSTRHESLTIESLVLHETRYPLEPESRFRTDDFRFARFEPLAIRTLQMCAHETYIDCPFYEQLMYIGDTRLQTLITYVLSHDERLPRKALRLFSSSRLPSGLTASRYPSRERQVIPPFSLWWIGMVHDFMMWRGDAGLVRELLPVARSVIDYFIASTRESGLVHRLAGWNFLDWVPGWAEGVPPGAAQGANASVNWQLVLALREAAELENWCGEPLLADRFRAHAASIENCIQAAFWNEERGMFSEDLAQEHYTEHAQCLAVLAGGLAPDRLASVRAALLGGSQIVHTTVYFSHYLFEAYRLLGCGATLKTRLEPWFNMPEMGLKTTIESPEPARSDCHGWSAHPLFHWYATLLGIRPDAPGFTRVVIAPMSDALTDVHATMVHPNGEIVLEIRQSALAIEGRVVLPPGIPGKLKWRGRIWELRAGPNEFHLEGLPS